MAVGKKLCECLVFRVFSDRNLLPEGSGAKRPWPGCAGSAIIFLAFPRALLLNRAPRGGKGHPITLSAERITRCSLALSLAASMFGPHYRSRKSVTPRNLQDSTVATGVPPSMIGGVGGRVSPEVHYQLH